MKTPKPLYVESRIPVAGVHTLATLANSDYDTFNDNVEAIIAAGDGVMNSLQIILDGDPTNEYAMSQKISISMNAEQMGIMVLLVKIAIDAVQWTIRNPKKPEEI